MRLSPAVIVYDVASGRARRLLEGHASVQSDPWIPVVQGRTMRIFGLFAIRPGVDSIALDRSGRQLVFAAVTAEHFWRADVSALADEAQSADELARRVQPFASKPMSDGLSTDTEGGIYVTDPEHSAVLRLAPDGTLTTLVKDARLRWPDGLSFGPDGWLYVTCSALHQVIGRTPGQVRRAAPFHVYRFRPGYDAPAGQ
jgi:sugar lactone lactonase YvrE